MTGNRKYLDSLQALVEARRQESASGNEYLQDHPPIREIIAYCEWMKAESEAAWRDPKRWHPAEKVRQYQTELIPLAILPFCIGQRLTPEAHQAINGVLRSSQPG